MLNLVSTNTNVVDMNKANKDTYICYNIELYCKCDNRHIFLSSILAKNIDFDNINNILKAKISQYHKDMKGMNEFMNELVMYVPFNTVRV